MALSKSKKRRRGPARRSGERETPSLVFFIALAVGIILLIWMFYRSVGTSTRQRPASTSGIVVPFEAGAEFPPILAS